MEPPPHAKEISDTAREIIRNSTCSRQHLRGIDDFHIHGQNRAGAALAGPQSSFGRGQGRAWASPPIGGRRVFGDGLEGVRGGVRLNLAAWVLGDCGAMRAWVGEL